MFNDRTPSASPYPYRGAAPTATSTNKNYLIKKVQALLPYLA